jgi:hypothetical protein
MGETFFYVVIGIVLVLVALTILVITASDMNNPTGTRFSGLIKFLLLPFSAIVYFIFWLFSRSARLNDQKTKKQKVPRKK